MNNEILEIINSNLKDSDKHLTNKISEIVNVILNAPLNTETSIAELINYNPETEMIDPLSQGIIKNTVEKVCNKYGIEFGECENGFSGLAFYNKFKTINNKSNDMSYLFEQDENGAYIRLIIPSDFVSMILSPEKTDAMDLRRKRNSDLSSDEVIVLKKYAYELSEKN